MTETICQDSDEELLLRMANGDEESFVTLYRRRQAAVYRFALQMSGSPSVAEDVTQEVFMALIKDCSGYSAEKGKLAGYFIRYCSKPRIASSGTRKVYGPDRNRHG